MLMLMLMVVGYISVTVVVPVLQEKHLNSISDNLYKIAGPP